MMTKIVIVDWSKGLKVISLTRMLKDKYGFSLKEARVAVIDLVDKRKEISVSPDNDADISDVMRDMDQFDITYKIVD